jgi:hypothetical protein
MLLNCQYEEFLNNLIRNRKNITDYDALHRFTVSLDLQKEEILKYLVGHAGQVEIKPLDLLVKGADQQIVPARVDGYGGDPLGSCHQLLGQLLHNYLW